MKSSKLWSTNFKKYNSFLRYAAMHSCEGRAPVAAHAQCLEHLMDFHCLKHCVCTANRALPSPAYMKSMHMQAPKEKEEGCKRNSSSWLFCGKELTHVHYNCWGGKICRTSFLAHIYIYHLSIKIKWIRSSTNCSFPYSFFLVHYGQLWRFRHFGGPLSSASNVRWMLISCCKHAVIRC